METQKKLGGCSRCKNEAIIELPYVSEKLCGTCFIKFFEKRVRRTIRRHDLLDPCDKTAIALSGGKDSMAVLSILAGLSKKAPKSELFAIIVNEGYPGYRDSLLKTAEEYCKRLGVPLHVIEFKSEFGLTIPEIIDKTKEKELTMPPCSYCGVFRRHLLNLKARELGATKIVTGHNLDDECQTGLMNFLRGDALKIGRSGALVGAISDAGFVPRIKPLRDTPEDEIELYTKLLEIPTAYGKCPYARDSIRTRLGEFLKSFESDYPGTRYQTLSSIDGLSKFLKESLVENKVTLEKCETCGEPSSRGICQFCQLKSDIGL